MLFFSYRHSSPHLPPDFRISMSSVFVEALSPQAGSARGALCAPRESPGAAVWALNLSWLTELNKAIHKGKENQVQAAEGLEINEAFGREGSRVFSRQSCPRQLGRGTNALSKHQNLVLLYPGHSLSPASVTSLLQKEVKVPCSLLSGTNKYLFMPHYVARSV